jgi:hypothetical membrane protein
VRRGVGAASIAGVLLLGVGTFWGAILVAAAGEPGYSNRRDYVSTLAAHGAEYGELAVLGIVAAGCAMIAAAVLVWSLSRMGAVTIGLAGLGFVVAAFIRLECPRGAAACGLGGRLEVSGSTEIGHWTATTLSSILLIAGMAIVGVALVGRGQRHAGIASVVAAALTAAAFLATGGDNPGGVQRAGIVVATGWLACLGFVALHRRGA